MPMSQYAVYLCDAFGQRLADASSFIKLSYTRVVNDVSSLKLTLPSNFDTSFIRAPDGRIEVWRRLPSGREYLDTETTWLTKVIDLDRSENGLKTIVVEADHPLSLLREPGRIVDYAANTSQALKSSTPTDDMIKAIIRENIGSSATNTARDLSAYLSVAANISLGPSTTKAFAWQDVLGTLRKIAAESTENGTYLAFDIVAPTPDTLEFRTYTQQRGVDHRFPNGNNPIIISTDFGNLGQANLRIDYRNEVTWVRAGGQGNGSDRVTQTDQDDTRIGASPFGLRESFVEATQYKPSDTTGLLGEATAAVRRGRPRLTFRGKLLNTNDTQYGVQWGWGDYLTVQEFGYQFDCRVDAIKVSVDQSSGGQAEDIDVWLRSETYA